MLAKEQVTRMPVLLHIPNFDKNHHIPFYRKKFVLKKWTDSRFFNILFTNGGQKRFLQKGLFITLSKNLHVEIYVFCQ